MATYTLFNIFNSYISVLSLYLILRISNIVPIFIALLLLSPNM